MRVEGLKLCMRCMDVLKLSIRFLIVGFISENESERCTLDLYVVVPLGFGDRVKIPKSSIRAM